METSLITAMGPTWTGGSQTTLCDIVVVIACPYNWTASMPCHRERWGAGSQKLWKGNGGGYLNRYGTLRDFSSFPTPY